MGDRHVRTAHREAKQGLFSAVIVAEDTRLFGTPATKATGRQIALPPPLVKANNLTSGW
jgi:hypothetical protein